MEEQIMSKIPESLLNDKLTQYLKANGYTLLGQGKVRDTWISEPGKLLVVATDRISIFDFVLNALIPQKGEILTALTHFWLTGPLSNYKNHLLQLPNASKQNEIILLKKSLPELPLGRCLLVEDLRGQLDTYEMIFRHHIGGSVYKKYLETGMAGGQKITPGLPQWSKLDNPIFTPSTKEEVGHDINIDASYYLSDMGNAGVVFETMLYNAYSSAYKFAEERGILILDTKFEGSSSLEKIADEILTPDSSRFVDIENWKNAMATGKDPDFLDKQVIREWGKNVETPFGVTGINKLDPENSEHLEFVKTLPIPQGICDKVSDTYHEILRRLTTYSLKEYQKEVMGI